MRTKSLVFDIQNHGFWYTKLFAANTKSWFSHTKLFAANTHWDTIYDIDCKQPSQKLIPNYEHPIWNCIFAVSCLMIVEHREWVYSLIYLLYSADIDLFAVFLDYLLYSGDVDLSAVFCGHWFLLYSADINLPSVILFLCCALQTSIYPTACTLDPGICCILEMDLFCILKHLIYSVLSIYLPPSFLDPGIQCRIKSFWAEEI